MKWCCALGEIYEKSDGKVGCLEPEDDVKYHNPTIEAENDKE